MQTGAVGFQICAYQTTSLRAGALVHRFGSETQAGCCFFFTSATAFLCPTEHHPSEISIFRFFPFLPQAKHHLFVQLWTQSGNWFLLQLNRSPYGTSPVCPSELPNTVYIIFTFITSPGTGSGSYSGLGLL